MKNIKVKYDTETSYRAKFVLWLLAKAAPLHTIMNKDRKAWNLTSDDLIKYDIGSLGNTLAVFYKQQQFEPVAKAERHDVFHVLLNYSTSVIDEAAMQFFLLGNGKPSFFTTGSCVITFILFPSQWMYFVCAFKNGKAANSIKYWNFKTLLNYNIKELQQQIFEKK